MPNVEQIEGGLRKANKFMIRADGSVLYDCSGDTGFATAVVQLINTLIESHQSERVPQRPEVARKVQNLSEQLRQLNKTGR